MPRVSEARKATQKRKGLISIPDMAEKRGYGRNTLDDWRRVGVFGVKLKAVFAFGCWWTRHSWMDAAEQAIKTKQGGSNNGN